MTSVQNRQQRLSGNRFLLATIVLLSFLSSCAVLTPKPPVKSPSPIAKPVEPETSKQEVKPVETKVNSMVLLLPFQLDKINGQPSRLDVKRRELSLDFYQGFKLAIDDIAKKGNNFKLTVLDSRDNEIENSKLAMSPNVQSADLIIGPIFPKEIVAFSRSGKLTYSLQVSPLAASKPSQFNIPNLVSLAAPIDLHSQGLAEYLEKEMKPGDNIIIINKQDDDSFAFLTPLKKILTERKVYFTESENIDQITNKVNLTGRNLIVVGTTNKFTVNTILNDLHDIQAELGTKIELFGHPNWSKATYNNFNLKSLKTKVPTTYYVNSNKSNVRDFVNKYIKQFKVEPSEYAYKGFDTGYFFAYMLGKYGPNYPKHLTAEEYNGLQTNYRFKKYAQWGYVNTYIRILEFDGYNYVPVN